MITVLPLVSVLVSATSADAVIDTPRAAKQKLADTLASATSIDSISAHVSARARVVTFAITRDDTAFRVDVTTRKNGEVISLVVTPSDEPGSAQGGLTWLADELGTTAVEKLVVDEDGAVTIATAAGRKYMAIPGRGSGGNAAVEARWAAEWDRQPALH